MLWQLTSFLYQSCNGLVVPDDITEVLGEHASRCVFVNNAELNKKMVLTHDNHPDK